MFSLFRKPPAPSEYDYVGLPPASLRDLYDLLLRAPWRAVVAAMGAAFLLVNLLFAGAYALVGGVAGARPGSFAEPAKSDDPAVTRPTDDFLSPGQDGG